MTGRASHAFGATRARCGKAGFLSRVYRWFTERFGTRDLKEAKAVLEQLLTGAT